MNNTSVSKIDSKIDQILEIVKTNKPEIYQSCLAAKRTYDFGAPEYKINYYHMFLNVVGSKCQNIEKRWVDDIIVIIQRQD